MIIQQTGNMDLVNNKTKLSSAHYSLEHVNNIVEHVTFHSYESGFFRRRVTLLKEQLQQFSMA
jgi:hypothetical protein